MPRSFPDISRKELGSTSLSDDVYFAKNPICAPYLYSLTPLAEAELRCPEAMKRRIDARASVYGGNAKWHFASLPREEVVRAPQEYNHRIIRPDGPFQYAISYALQKYPWRFLASLTEPVPGTERDETVGWGVPVPLYELFFCM